LELDQVRQMKFLNTLRFIINHPLNADKKLKSIVRWLSWQVGSRLVPGPVAVRFVNDTVLLVEPGMAGATGNIYVGLHEFEDMAFVLHLLRKDDLFIDVGANIGSYTVLAGGAGGARCIAIEPVPGTYAHLMRNIALNDISGIATTRNLAVGGSTGTISFTTGLDTVNHVAVEDEIASERTMEVEVTTLDRLLEGLDPKLIKIDVEGYESEVIAGAEKVLSNVSLDAVIMELNGSGRRYGYDETVIHKRMLEYDFMTYDYSPFDRTLILLNGKNLKSGNTLYIRNPDIVKERLSTAPAFQVNGIRI
jgi:FkbM family methyltransferase